MTKAGWVEDMISLSELTEGSIMENLRARYASRLIYTYTGSILVALNPYEVLDIYNHNVIKLYANKRQSENPPHIFSTAEAAISHMKMTGANQSVIISGESGAGKSESTRYILSYLTAVSSNNSNESWVQQQILEANTVLESFGNAKTVRNNNSSRYGKFIEISFNNSHQIVGATIISYLLEKSRIAKQGKTERNYHVFYELIAGTSDHEKQQYLLQSLESYNYLSQSGCFHIEGISDRTHYESLKLAFAVLGFGEDELNGIISTLSAILWIGNIKFNEDKRNDCVQIDGTAALDAISKLLGVSASKLSEAFRTRKLTVRSETTVVPMKLPQALENRDSMAKTLYDHLFQKILNLINASLAPKDSPPLFIGVLDIFGFEVFELNSFEQFCINYTNEKLQQYFNQFIFKLEQEEYLKEGISWEKVGFVDNIACIDLIEMKAHGILPMLDEETKVPKGSDDSWLDKMGQLHDKHKHFSKPKTAKGQFVVRHYAGDVTYTVSGFLEKNKDTVQDELIDLISKSTNPFISTLFQAKAQMKVGPKLGQNDKPGTAKVTAGSMFRSQLSSLVSTLTATNCHYVRCIKPNTQKASFTFHEDVVIAQLRYSGMLETIKIRKAGYATRLEFSVFLKNYKALWPKGFDQDPKAKSVVLVEGVKIDSSHWQVGRSKMFLRTEALDSLTVISKQILTQKAIRIQCFIRCRIARRRFIRMRKAAVVIQAFMRVYIYRVRYNKMRQAAIKIQAVTRGWFARDYYRSLLEAKQEAERRLEEERRLAEERRIIEERRKIEEQRILEEQRRLLEERAAAEAAAAAAASAAAAAAAAAAANAGSVTAPALPEKVIEPLKTGMDDPEMKAKIDRIEEAIRTEEAAKTIQQRRASKLEEETLKQLSVAVQKKRMSAHKPDLDNMFSFLDDFQNQPEISNMAANITSEIDALIDKPPPEAAPQTPITPVTPTSSQLRKSAETLNSKSRPLKSNPLRKDLLDSSENISFDPTAEEWSLKAFAEKNFEIHMKKKDNPFAKLGLGGRPVSAELDDLLYHSKHTISGSIIRMKKHDEILNNLAIDCFKHLQKIMDPVTKKMDEVNQAIQQVISTGLEHSNLRDEVYVQIVKQMSWKQDDEPKGASHILLRGWEMIALTASSFPPTKLFSKFLLAFILRGQKEYKEKDIKYRLAKFSEEALKNSTLNGPRKLPPSMLEINAIHSGQSSIPYKFYTVNGTPLDVDVSSVTTAADVIREISRRIGIPDSQNWSLHIVSMRSEHAIRAIDYLPDIISSLERENKKHHHISPGNSLLRRLTKRNESDSQSVPHVESQIIIKKRIFRHPISTPTDPAEHSLLFEQAVDSVNRDSFHFNEVESCKLAALRAQGLMGDVDVGAAVPYFSKNLTDWIVPRITSATSKESLVKSIIDQYSALRGMSQIQAKFLYLQLVSSSHFYGAALFQVIYAGFWSFEQEILLAISAIGVEFVRISTFDVIMVFSFQEIQQFEVSGDTLTISVEKMGIASHDLEMAEVYKFTTAHAEEAVALMREYAPTKTAKVKEKIYTDHDIAALKKDVEKARSIMIDKCVLRIPGPEIGDSMTSTLKKDNKTFRGSLIMKSKNRLSKIRSRESLNSSRRGSRDSLNDFGSGVASWNNLSYTPADWSYSQTRLITSIMSTDSELELEDFAIQLHSMLLNFGQMDVNQTNFKTQNVTNHIQNILATCLRDNRYANELYLQLIKMTTNHPDPMSKEFAQYWSLMSIAVGVVVPISHYVLDYLKTHLRSCIAGETKLKSRYENQMKFAKYCLKTLIRTLASPDPRKNPPSSEELTYTSRQCPISIKFIVMNGQSRLLSIDPSENVENIFVGLLGKFNIKESTGFAIFKRFLGVESPLYAEDKFSDLLYSCEKALIDTLGGENVSFVLKKRLFINAALPLSNETEEELVRAQILDDIRNDLFPISLDDAIFSAALNAQAIFGDANVGTIDYMNIIAKFVPKRFFSPEVEGQVRKRHADLAGRPPQEVKRVFMDFIKSSPLFGTTIFNAMQSYTNQIPSLCWIGVSMYGIHIMAKFSKTPLVSHALSEVVSCRPAVKNILLVMENVHGTFKYVFTTEQSFTVAALIKDYIDIQRSFEQ